MDQLTTLSTNLVADLTEAFAKVRVIWGILGTLAATLGFTVPFLSEDFLTVGNYDMITSFIVATVGGAIAIYQANRKTVKPGVILSQSAIKDASVSFNPFGKRHLIG